MEPLAELLRKRLAVIADHGLRDRDPDAHLEQLEAVSEELMALHEQIKPGLPPRLAHFLQSCSYEKALDFIEQSRAAS